MIQILRVSRTLDEMLLDGALSERKMYVISNNTLQYEHGLSLELDHAGVCFESGNPLFGFKVHFIHIPRTKLDT